MDFQDSFNEEIIFDSNSELNDFNNFDMETTSDLKIITKKEEDRYEDIVYDHITELKIQQLDIYLPLVSLKSLLVANNIIDYSCSNIEYWLQGVEKCEGQTTFDSYCIKMKGVVQINLEVKVHLSSSTAHINIIDILVPCDKDGVVNKPNSPPNPKKKLKRDTKHPISSWVIDKEFQLIRLQHGFSTDLLSWTTEHVRLWLLWGQKHFQLTSLDLDNLSITGSEVNDWKLEEIQILAPYDKELLFWTHFQLLKKFKIVAIKMPKKLESNRGNKSGNNGQIQLWQFLLEILIDQDCVKIVQWVGADGEFCLKEPESVAKMWGMRKNRCGMTYEKMSRAMRYYYDGEVIKKVPHKRFHYKFVCDLQSKIGMSVTEIQSLTSNSKLNSKNYNEIDHMRLNRLLEALRSPVCSKRAEPLSIAPLNYKMEEVVTSSYDL